MRYKLAFLLVLLLVAPASATPEEAAKEIQKGMTAFNAGRYDDAYRSFQTAWDLDRSPVILLYLAQASANRKQATVSDALDHLNRWLSVAGAGQASPDWAYLPRAFAAVKALAVEQEQTITEITSQMHVLTAKVEKVERSYDMAQRQLEERDARLRDWEKRYDALEHDRDVLDRPGRKDLQIHAEPPGRERAPSDHGVER